MVGSVKNPGDVIAQEVVFISGWDYTHKGSVRAEGRALENLTKPHGPSAYAGRVKYHCCHVRLLRSEKQKWREESKGEGDGFICIQVSRRASPRA